MNNDKATTSTVAAATIGLLALASAMGIGRFSLTPVLPLMQGDMGLTISQGNWLATANYLGYLIGALTCMALAPSPARAIRWGLASVAIFTVAMGFTRLYPVWLAFRFLSGLASPFVLIGVSAWAMPILAQRDKANWSGIVFAGVGVGITFAGFIGLAAGLQAWGSPAAWLTMGLVASALVIALWWPLAPDSGAANAAASKRGDVPREVYIVVTCYGLFGYGYIIPATFLPALARAYVNDPAVFGWVWPVFGVAAAGSTVLASQLGHHLTPRRLWMLAQWLMIAGLVAPVLALNVPTLIFAAICVGGTFMVITMAGVKEVLRIGGPNASRGIGMVTAAFAAGQIAGPFTVNLFAGWSNTFAITSLMAATALVLGNWALWRTTSNAFDSSSETRPEPRAALTDTPR
jgi:predicted MFS family arabinose efflux permease